MTQRKFHFIGGPGGMGTSALFKKLHAACRKHGILITICTQSSLAALTFDGETTAHSLFLYPVKDKNDIDDQNLPTCNFNKEHCNFFMRFQLYFGMSLFQMTAYLLKLSCRNSKRDGIHHVSMCLSVRVTLLRYVFI
jgi:hypothetical protein